MIHIISAILILFSSVASFYYSYVGLAKPDTLSPYNKAKIPRNCVQLLSLILGIGGLLLLFPQTFILGGALLMIHSLATIACYVSLKEWKEGFFEFLFLQIPIFLIWAGHPLPLAEDNRSSFNKPKTETYLTHNDDRNHEFAIGENEAPIKLEVLKQHHHKKQHDKRVIQQIRILIFDTDKRELVDPKKSIKTATDSGINSTTATGKVAFNTPYTAYDLKNSFDYDQRGDGRTIKRVKHNKTKACLFSQVKYSSLKNRYGLTERNRYQRRMFKLKIKRNKTAQAQTLAVATSTAN